MLSPQFLSLAHHSASSNSQSLQFVQLVCVLLLLLRLPASTHRPSFSVNGVSPRPEESFAQSRLFLCRSPARDEFPPNLCSFVYAFALFDPKPPKCQTLGAWLENLAFVLKPCPFPSLSDICPLNRTLTCTFPAPILPILRLGQMTSSKAQTVPKRLHIRPSRLTSRGDRTALL